MIDRSEARYFVVRYMHDELREETANVGVILLVPADGQVRVRFLDNLVSKSRPDSRIDARLVEEFEDWVHAAIEDLAEARAASDEFADALESALREQTGNVIRLSRPRTVLLTDPAEEMEMLFNEWVAPRRRTEHVEPRARDPLGGLRRQARGAIIRALRDGLLAPRQRLRRDVDVPGVVHMNRFDAAVIPSPGRTIRLFHHVLVLREREESYNQAAAVARRWLDVKSKNGQKRSLTAVLYSREEPNEATLPDAAELFKQDGIEVASVSGLRRIAPTLVGPGLFDGEP